MGKVIDETGNTYGRLIVLGRASNDTKCGRAIWLCSCACGNQKITRGDYLRNGSVRSCGCLQRESQVRCGKITAKDEKGNVYGRLSVIERVGSDQYGAATWRCQCECGATIITTGCRLRSEATQSCGCYCRDRVREAASLPPGQSACNTLLNEYRQRAKRKEWAWELTKEQFVQLTQQPCHYCGRLPWLAKTVQRGNGAYLYNGIDRLCSDRGYALDNIVSCCWECNRAKSDMSYENFLDMISRIAKHLGLECKR